MNTTTTPASTTEPASPVSVLGTPRRERTFPVMEIFGPTIQGEGLVAGTQTFFIRFGLCDYKCTKCDSLHAVDPNYVSANATWMTTDEIIDKLREVSSTNGPAPWVTLSGGNPAIHDLTRLVIELHDCGYKIAVETQGTLCPPWLHMVDVLTCSPKPPGMGETFEPEKYTHFLDLFYKHSGLNIKIPVFSSLDLEFAASVWELSTGWLEGCDIFYLSQGNPWPPELGLSDRVQEPTYCHATATLLDDEHLALALLKEFKDTYAEIQKDPRLQHYRFLPQLHVLVWGNARGK